MKITLTLDLTPENLEKLKTFMDEPAPANEATSANEQLSFSDMPEVKAEAPAPEAVKTTKKENIKLSDLRVLARKFIDADRKPELEAIFTKFGAKRLPDIQEADFAALMEELVNANG